MPSTNTRTPRPARQQSAARPPLLWRGHRVRERVAITTPDLKRVIRELAPAGVHDLALYMWMLASMQYVAGKDGRPDTATVSQTYQALAKSVNMSATLASTRTSNVTRAVKRLDDAKLVASKRAPGRGTVIRLLRADGSGRPYAMPNMERGAKVILPGEFFSNGWHATLSKAALALLLAGCRPTVKMIT